MKKFALLAIAALTLSGCSATVNLEPAPDANNPACAEVIVRLPDEIDGNKKRVTGAQATSAWGTPTAVIMRCGLEPVMASKLPCITQAGVDWLVDETNAPSYRFITFGRTPALEVVVDSNKVAGVTALDSLASQAKYLPSTRNCG